MTNTAVYTRISMDRTGEQLGVQRQYDACVELSKRLGWNVTHHFDDNDISASSDKYRPGYDALLTAMESGEVDSVLYYHTDRMFRGWPAFFQLLEILKTRNIACKGVVSGDLDLSTATGRQMASMMCAMNIGETERMSERRKAANAQARAAGKWRNGGAAVFGYDKKGQIVEHEGVLIRKAAADLLAGRSLRSLAKEWTKQGIQTRRGGPWSTIGFRHMISNPRYAGLVTHKKQVVGKGEWEAIIDEDTHLAITALLADPARRSHHSHERIYQGSGIYLCAQCGGTLRPITEKKTKTGVRHVSYGCPAGFHLTVRVEPLDAFVSEVILGILELDADRIDIDDSAADVAELARRRDGLQERLNALSRMFATGEIDGEQLKSGSAELHQQLAGINSLIAGLLRTSPAANLLNSDGDNLRERWDACSPEMRGRIIDELCTVTVLRVGQARGRWGRIEDRVVITPK